MKCLGQVVFLAILMVCICGRSYALQLLHPLDGTYVTKSNYLIIKGGDDPALDGLSIEINGIKSDVIGISSEEYRAAFGDMLIVEPLFDPGENRIVIEGYLGDEKMSTVVATIFYLDRVDAVPPAAFSKDVFHLSDREKACVGCHNMAPSLPELASADPSQNPCASCHMRMLDKAHVHGPAGVYECTYCHVVDSSPNKYQVRTEGASLCMECHKDKLDEYRQSKFVHGPIEAGLCLVCHDPHASSEKAQLVMPVFDLCSECHARVAQEPHVTRGSVGKVHPLRGVANPAGMGEDLSCASCHDPHSGTTSAMFRWGLESRFGLCAKCHKN